MTGTYKSANRTVCAAIRHVGELVEGEDPKNIELTWHKIFRQFTYMGSRGASTNVISGIDIALWDIQGKVVGLPIYELFGGVVRDSVSHLLPSQRRLLPAANRAARTGHCRNGADLAQNRPPAPAPPRREWGI
ncbi:MAG: galactonate dehydratase [Candidatus Latescibacterota bacterium]|jgi:galactonate dehydratase